MSTTVIGSYVASGKNPSLEVQQLRLVYSNNSITVSGSTAKTTVSATLSVKRDSYGSTYGLTASCYITINGNKKTASYDDTVDTSWRTVMTHSVSVSYTASNSKSVSLGAGFNMSSNSKLKGLVLPASSYAYGTGTQSGSLTLTLSKQITKCGAPKVIELNRISKTGSIVTPNETIEISWSGATNGVSNTIATYQVYYRITSGGSAPTTSTYTGTKNVNVKNGTTYGSTTITLSNAERGCTIVAGVVTRGTAGSSYYSSLKTGGKLTVNRLPNPPSVKASATTVKSTGNNVTFTVSAGSDSDGQTRTLYYSRSSGGTKTKFTSPLSLSISKNNNSVYFYTYDGMEYSKATPKTITINTKPVIKSFSISKIELLGLNEDPAIPLVRKGSFSASLNKTVSSYKWYFSQSSTSSINTGTKTLFSTSSKLSSYNFDNLAITKGYYYKVGLIVSDAYESSDIFWEDDLSQMPKDPLESSIQTIINSPDGDYIQGTNPNQFENGVFLSWTNPILSTGMLNIEESRPFYRVRENSSSAWNSLVLGENKDIGSGSNNTASILLEPNRGYEVQFGIRITDSGGKTINTYYEPNFIRATLPFFGKEELAVTGPVENGKLTIHPYTNTNTLAFSGVKVTSDNGAKYFLDCIVNDKTVTINLLSEKDKTEIEQGDTIFITLSAENINNLLKDNRLKNSPDDLVWNDDYSNVIYKLYAKDLFGNISSNSEISSLTNINFIESPVFSNLETITMGIQYYLPNMDTSNFLNSINYPSIDNSIEPKKINNDRMFNPGEAIVFKFSKPQDYNEDVYSYEIYVSRMDERPISISKDKNYEDYTYTLLTSFLASNAQNDELNSKLIYQHPINTYLQNKFVTFYIVALDSKGNRSNKLYCNTYLVGCRKQEPSVSLNTATITEQNKISLKYTINDLGGTRFNEDSEYKYKASTDDNSYPNFEREISIKFNSEDILETNYAPRAFLHIQYCLDGDFTNQSAENYNYQIIPIDTEYSLLGGTILSDDIGSFKGKKLYIRLRLVLLTGFGSSQENYENIGDYTKYDIVSAITEIVTYYADMPTVSHRSHHVGINTNNFDDINSDEILIVSDFMDREKIVLIGTDTSEGEAKEYRITIYLKQGKIDGAYIPGGSWDEI